MSYTQVLENQRRIEESLVSRMEEMEKSLKAASTPDSKPNIENLAREFVAFKETVSATMQLMRVQVQSLNARVEDLDAYNRRNALLFSGINEQDGEDCAATILNVLNSIMNFPEVKSTDFFLCHRLGIKNNKRTRPILVRFTNMNLRNLIWKEKKRLKSTSTVLSEFLTKSRQDIFAKARRHFGINSCWTRDGVIMLKLPNNDRKRIVTAEELDQLVAKYPARTSSTVSGQGTSSSQPRPESTPPAAAVPAPLITRRNAATKSKTIK